MEEYLVIRFKKRKVNMSIFRTGLSLVFLLLMANQLFAQAVSKDYQKNCAREQVIEHHGIKGKAHN